MKTKILLLSLCLLFLFLSWRPFLATDQEQELIAILQTTSHPALDAVKESFKKELEQTRSSVQFIEQNGFGQMSSLQVSAQSFRRNPGIKLILAIGTPAVQAIASIEKEKPIVFAAVTDPTGLKVDFERSNVFGLSDAVNAIEQIAVIQKKFPNVKKIGLLFSPSESNSLSAVHRLEEAITQANLKSFQIGIQSTNDLAATLESASGC